MARGQKAKEEIINKILKTFEGSFLYNQDKELRIPIVEDGETVQIKCTFTCAKVNVPNPAEGGVSASQDAPKIDSSNLEITKEEKEQTVDLLKSLGL